MKCLVVGWRGLWPWRPGFGVGVLAGCGSSSTARAACSSAASSGTSTVSNKDKPAGAVQPPAVQQLRSELDSRRPQLTIRPTTLASMLTRAPRLSQARWWDYIEKNIASLDRNGDGIVVTSSRLATWATTILSRPHPRRAQHSWHGRRKDGKVVSGPIGTNTDETFLACQDIRWRLVARPTPFARKACLAGG